MLGLNAVTHIKHGLAIWFNNSLISISSLNSLTYTNGISIWLNPSLVELNGFGSLASVDGNIHVDNNSSLQSLSSLQNITLINGNLSITNNSSLQSLSGLDNIAANSITGLYIGNNNSLSECAVKSVCDYLLSPTGIDSIYNNAAGCNNEEEVEAACNNTGIELNVKVLLQGAYSANNTMNNGLSEFLPNNQPYDTITWNYYGMEALDSIPNNMVDWILIEIRDSVDYTVINDMRAGILLSDGSIKDTNLVEGLRFYNIDSGYYYIAVRHRNHISVMTGQPVYLSPQNIIDFTDSTIIEPYGGASQAQIEIEPGIWGMISGDINNDGKLIYSGPDNDRMNIIQLITNVSGSTSITTVIIGYYLEDLDLNSQVKYSGPNNDGAIIIQNIISLTGSTSITSVYTCPVLFLYQ